MLGRACLLVAIFQVSLWDLTSGEIYFRKGAPHAKLANNALLSGSVEFSREGRPFHSFLGVPYGNIPERFQEAQPTPAWEGVHDTVNPGPKCSQSVEFAGKVITFGEEDCLTLNVFSPMNNTQRKGGLPVMVWVHGGGFSLGSGHEYGPKYFMDEDVILVTFNYRLGVFGFMSSGDEVISGNYGLKDQVLALRWVKDNIRSFGGDAGKVTIFGESAGGASVHLLLLSPATNGLFHRAIAQSGSALSPWAVNVKPRATAEQIATYLKCSTAQGKPADITSEEILTCLKRLTAKELNEAQSKFITRWPPLAIPIDFVPVIEPTTSPSAFLTESPWKTLTENTVPLKPIPFMTGTTPDECTALYAGYSLQNQELMDELDTSFGDIIITATQFQRMILPGEEPIVADKIRKYYFGEKAISFDLRDNLTSVYSDGMFVHSVRKGALQTAAKGNGSPVYLYQYAHLGPVPAMRLFGFHVPEEEAQKVGHGDDMLMHFNLVNEIPDIEDLIVPDSPHEEMSKHFVKLWVSFAIHGKPKYTWGTMKEEWKPLTKNEALGKAPLRWYKINTKPGYFDEGKLKDRTQFWETLYKDHFLDSLLPQSSTKDGQKTEL